MLLVLSAAVFTDRCFWHLLDQLVTAPIIEIGKTAAAIGGGDMTARVNIGRVIFRDEIDDLRLIFNSMVEEIAASHDAMEQKASPLKDFFLDLSVLCMFAVGGPLISKFAVVVFVFVLSSFFLLCDLCVILHFCVWKTVQLRSCKIVVALCEGGEGYHY
jgi:nitrogen fixation/metabolism regulation signal transduction histidine kinase